MTQRQIANILFALVLLGIAIIWYIIQAQYMVAGNISWLLTSAERLIAGQSLSEHIYETNPPLSILIYTPHVLISQLLGIPLTTSFVMTSFALLCLSTLCISSIAKRFTYLSFYDQKAIILAYLIASTVCTNLFFGEREFHIILALFPFILCQFAITERIKIPLYILLPTMALGATMILVKPHYGLIPVVFIMERFIQQKEVKALFQIDFWALAIATSLYIIAIFIFFNDYATIIFPDVMELYVSMPIPLSKILYSIRESLFIFPALLLWELFQRDLEEPKKRLLIRLYIACILCLIPYITQMKGFYNHIMPAYVFLMPAISLSISFRLARLPSKFSLIRMLAPLPCIIFIATNLSHITLEYPKRSNVQNLPVATYLKKHCNAPCSFFVFHSDIEIFNPTAAHLGYTYASRFPTMWFIPSMLMQLQSDDPKQQDHAKQLKERYATYLADDFEYYKPDIILIYPDMPIGTTKAFNFFDFFSDNEKINNIIENHYDKLENFKFDRAKYFTGTSLSDTYMLNFEAYKRKAPQIIEPNPS